MENKELKDLLDRMLGQGNNGNEQSEKKDVKKKEVNNANKNKE